MVPEQHRTTLEAACQFKNWQTSFSWRTDTEIDDLFTCVWSYGGAQVGTFAIHFTDPSTMFVKYLTIEEAYQRQALFKHLVLTITPWAQESRYLDMKIQVAGPGRKAFELAGYPIDDYGYAEGNIEDTPENRELHPEVASFYDWLKGEQTEPVWRKERKLEPQKIIRPRPAPATPTESIVFTDSPPPTVES
jgi:hypothetical protein